MPSFIRFIHKFTVNENQNPTAYNSTPYSECFCVGAIRVPSLIPTTLSAYALLNCSCHTHTHTHSVCAQTEPRKLVKGKILFPSHSRSFHISPLSMLLFIYMYDNFVQFLSTFSLLLLSLFFLYTICSPHFLLISPEQNERSAYSAHYIDS